MKKINRLIAGEIMLLVTILYIVLIKTVDVAAIGPENTSVGLSHINKAVHKLLGEHDLWYKFTELFGVFALMLAAAFACVGLYQLITRKSLVKVDRAIYALAVLYVIVIILYVFFEKVIVNYRPVIMKGEEHPEASFPSSHTMLVCTIFGSFILVSKKYIENESIRRAAVIASVVITVLTVCGRLISGVHWFTDIIGGLLISASLLFIFSAFVESEE